MIPILAVTLLAAPRPTDSTLSILVPEGAKCEWHRVDPLLKDDLTLATFDVPCQGGEISWSHERDHAVFFFPDPASAFEVDLVTLEVTPIPLPARGTTAQIGFDVDGDLVALTWDPATLQRPSLEIDGKRFHPIDDLPGLPTLAHAWRRERGGWTREETVVTSVEACDAPAELALEASHRFEPGGSREVLLPTDTGDEIRDVALLDRLAPFGHREKLGGGIPDWLARTSPEGTIVVGQEQDDLPYAATPVLFLDEYDRPVLAPGLERGRVIVTPERGPWLLVTDASSGTLPRLYDLRTRTLVWSSDTAMETVFWPE